MKKNKLILFDWGNIVESHTTGYSCYDAWTDLFNECGYITDESTFKYLGKYRLSSIPNEEEFKKTYELMKEDFHFTKTYDEFVEIYRRIFKKIDYYIDVADYEVSLKDKCYIGILSNLTVFDKERLGTQVNLPEYDYVFLSFELACRKPERVIFEKVQDKLPFDKKDILLIDDRSDNIEMAKEFGWNAFQATGLELDKIKEVCENFIDK
jgi:HAD superfamily hydrolase (TIGR01509 family)